MALTPNWSPERRRAEHEKADLRKAERRALKAQAAAEEAAEVERIRQVMETKFGEGAQFIACRRGKTPVFGRSK